MRVLFLFPRTLDAKTSVGGVAEFLCALTPVLKTLGVEPIIYAGDKKQKTLVGPLKISGDVTVYNGPFLKPGWWVSKRKLQPVLEVCARHQIDVLHAQGTYTAGFLARQIQKRTQIPYVVTSHNDILETNSKRMQRKNVQRRCQQVLKHANAVTHLTSIMEDASHKLWDTRAKSATIGNGIDCSVRQPFLGLPEKNYFLGIGRLERGKGFHVLIEMFQRLLQNGVSDSLIIAGKGNAENDLFEQVKALGINLVTEFNDFANIPECSVIFTGYVRGAEKQRLIAQSKAVLFATQPDLWEEAFSIVQLEVMAAGRAMLASDTAATRYLQSLGLQSLVVQPDDVSAWTEQALLLLQDNDLRQQLGKANLTAVTKFDWPTIAEQYKKVFLKACE